MHFNPPDEPVRTLHRLPANLQGGFDPQDGFVGLWTTVLTHNVADANCIANPTDCTLDNTGKPERPELIVGLDGNDPIIGEGDGGNGIVPENINDTHVKLDFTVDEPDFPFGSGLVKVRCRNEEGPLLPCTDGGTWEVTPGFGAKQITIFATDAAGNVGVKTVDLFYSGLLAPGSTEELVPALDPEAWYTSAPSVKLTYHPSVLAPNVLPGTPPFRWAVDKQSEKECDDGDPVLVCTIPASELANLPSGTHTLGSTAIDKLGFRHTRLTYMKDGITFKTDYVDPVLSTFVIPPDPDGENGWYRSRPIIVAASEDDEGGSGLDRIEYQIDGEGLWLEYDEPFHMPPGTHSVCLRAPRRRRQRNARQRPLSRSASERRRHPRRSAQINEQPVDTPPDGTPGSNWWVTVPLVSFLFNDSNGSGIPSESDQKAIRYRIDNGPYVQCATPCPVQDDLAATGHHEVQWSAVDEAGNRRLEQTVRLNIDTEAPLTRASVATYRPRGPTVGTRGKPRSGSSRVINDSGRGSRAPRSRSTTTALRNTPARSPWVRACTSCASDRPTSPGTSRPTSARWCRSISTTRRPSSTTRRSTVWTTGTSTSRR